MFRVWSGSDKGKQNRHVQSTPIYFVWFQFHIFINDKQEETAHWKFETHKYIKAHSSKENHVISLVDGCVKIPIENHQTLISSTFPKIEKEVPLLQN